MITAIFNKSKPINLVFVALVLFFSFCIVKLQTGDLLNWTDFFYNLLQLGAAILSVLLVDFIVKKNSISEQNSFVILFFSLFFFCFWSGADTGDLMFSNVFVLLALRKIISLKTQTNTTQKIFDASLWLCVAVLFYFWAILFFVVLYIGIALYVSDYYKNWLVPFVGVFTVFTIVLGYEMLMHQQFYQFENTAITRGFQEINTTKDITILTFFLLILLVSLFFLSASVKTKLQKNKMSYVILLFTLLVALIIVILAPNKSVSMLLFGYFPLAALFSVFFEKIAKDHIQSIIIFTLLIASVFLSLFSI